MKTWKLDKDWDVGLDDLNNIAMVDGNDRLAQDVASSVRVFKGELPFDIDRGVTYDKPDEVRNTLKNDMNEQALLVEGVSDSITVFNNLTDRLLNVTIYATNEEGETITVGAE